MEKGLTLDDAFATRKNLARPPQTILEATAMIVTNVSTVKYRVKYITFTCLSHIPPNLFNVAILLIPLNVSIHYNVVV